MALVEPFSALRYDPDRVDASRVLAPALDLVDEEKRAASILRDPRSVLSILADVPGLTARENRSRHDFFVAELSRAGILRRDDAPAFYVMRETYESGKGDKKTRMGFFATVDTRTGAPVLPHEETLHDVGKPKRRPREPISLAFQDERGRVMRTFNAEIADRDPDLKAAQRGVTVELWVVDDETACARVTALLEEEPLLIADGHHRFQSRTDEDPFPAFLSSRHEVGNRLGALHRVVELPGFRRELFLDTASRFFYAEELTSGADYKAMLVDGPRPRAILVDKKGMTLLTLKDGAPLDEVEALPAEATVRAIPAATLPPIVINHLLAVEDALSIQYTGSSVTVLDLVARGDSGQRVGLLLPPPSFDAIIASAQNGALVPPKTTCFMPKPPNGVVLATW